MKKACLIVMVRCPEPGQVKTRLATTIGEQGASELYECFVEDLLKSLEGIPADLRIGFHPPNGRKCIENWLGSRFELIPQQGRDLGERQASLLQEAFSMGYGSAIVMISDAPDIPAEMVNGAIRALGSSDSVIGPCRDGGYYLIGFRAASFHKDLFQDITWGGPSASSTILDRMKGSGPGTVVLDTWWDIDDHGDLEAFFRRSQERGYTGSTMSYIERRGLFHGR
jgi:rSAM/selenodomain-associated transferase 1